MNPSGSVSAVEGVVILAVILALTVISWSLMSWLDRRQDRREQR